MSAKNNPEGFFAPVDNRLEQCDLAVNNFCISPVLMNTFADFSNWPSPNHL
jgi:hypothetical protein